MNNHELAVKVASAVYKLVGEKGYAAPVDVLLEIGALNKENYEKWRRGQVGYLERVCTINLHKLSAVMHEIRVCAKKADLKESWTAYNQWGVKGKNIRLRFSKSGSEQIERSYAAHYVRQNKTE